MKPPREKFSHSVGDSSPVEPNQFGASEDNLNKPKGIGYDNSPDRYEAKNSSICSDPSYPWIFLYPFGDILGGLLSTLVPETYRLDPYQLSPLISHTFCRDSDQQREKRGKGIQKTLGAEADVRKTRSSSGLEKRSRWVRAMPLGSPGREVRGLQYYLDLRPGVHPRAQDSGHVHPLAKGDTNDKTG